MLYASSLYLFILSSLNEQFDGSASLASTRHDVITPASQATCRSPDMLRELPCPLLLRVMLLLHPALRCSLRLSVRGNPGCRMLGFPLTFIIIKESDSTDLSGQEEGNVKAEPRVNHWL